MVRAHDAVCFCVLNNGNDLDFKVLVCGLENSKLV